MFNAITRLIVLICRIIVRSARIRPGGIVRCPSCLLQAVLLAALDLS